MPPKPAAKGKGKSTKPAAPTGPKQTPEEAQAILKSLIQHQDIVEVRQWASRKSSDVDTKIGEVTQIITKLRHQQGLPSINPTALATATRKDSSNSTVLPTKVSTVANNETVTSTSVSSTLSISATDTVTSSSLAGTDKPPLPPPSSSSASSLPTRVPGFGKANLYSPYGLMNYSLSPTSSFLFLNNNPNNNNNNDKKTNTSTVGNDSTSAKDGTVTNPSTAAMTTTAVSSTVITIPLSSDVRTLCTKIGNAVCQSFHYPYPPPLSNHKDIFNLFNDYDTKHTGYISISDIHDIFMLKGIDTILTLSSNDEQLLYTTFGKLPIVPNESVKTKMSIDYTPFVNVILDHNLMSFPSGTANSVGSPPASTMTTTPTTTSSTTGSSTATESPTLPMDTSININTLPNGPSIPPRADAPVYPTIQDLVPLPQTMNNNNDNHINSTTNPVPSTSTASPSPAPATTSTAVLASTANPSSTIPTVTEAPTSSSTGAVPHHQPSTTVTARTGNHTAPTTGKSAATTKSGSTATSTMTKKPGATTHNTVPTKPGTTTTGSKTPVTSKTASRPGSTVPHTTSSSSSSSRRTSTVGPSTTTSTASIHKSATTGTTANISSSSRRPSQVQNNLPTSGTTNASGTTATTGSAGSSSTTTNETLSTTANPSSTPTTVTTASTPAPVAMEPSSLSNVVPTTTTVTSSTGTSTNLPSVGTTSTMNLMLPIPVTITMGPNGPMAIPMGMGSVSAASSTAPYLAPLSTTATINGTTNTATTVPTDPSTTAAAERELALLTKLKETMKVNEALKAELSNFDDTFFEEIEDVKYRLAIAEGKVIPPSASSSSASATVVAASSTTTVDTKNSTTEPSTKEPVETKKPITNDPTVLPAKLSSSNAPSRRVSFSVPTPASSTTNNNDKDTSSTTTQHIEAGLTQGRKLFRTTWEQATVSPPRDLPKLIGAPLSPNGIPMLEGTNSNNTNTNTGNVSRASPVRGSPVSLTGNPPSVTKPQSTTTTLPRSTTLASNEVQQLRSAWNAVAFAPKPKPVPVTVPDIAKDLAKTEFNNPSVVPITNSTNNTVTASRRPSTTSPTVPVTVLSSSSSSTTPAANTTTGSSAEPSKSTDKPPSAAAVIASRRSSAVLEAAATTIKTVDTVIAEADKARGLPPRIPTPTPTVTEAVTDKPVIATKGPLTVEEAVKQSITDVEVSLSKPIPVTDNIVDKDGGSSTASSSGTTTTVPVATESTSTVVESSTAVPTTTTTTSIPSRAPSPTKGTNTVPSVTIEPSSTNVSSVVATPAIIGSAVDDLLPLPTTGPSSSSSPSRPTLSPLPVNTMNNNFDDEEADYSVRNNNNDSSAGNNGATSSTKDGKEDRVLIVAGRAVVIPTPQSPKKVTDIEENLTVIEAFPTATEGNYAVRALTRKALVKKKDTANSPYRTKSPSPIVNDPSNPAVPSPVVVPSSISDDLSASAVDLYGLLDTGEREALALAFDRYEEKENHIGPRPRIAPAVNKTKEKLKHTVTPLDFEKGLISLGLRLDTDMIAELISGLRLDRSGRVEYSDFIRFVSLPLVLSMEDKDTLILTSDGVPQPPDALPSPVFDRPGNPRSPRPVFKGYTKPVKPSAKMNGPWAYADSDTTRTHAPKVHVPWPVDISRADSAFWKGVNDLETLMLKEVNKRAKVSGIAPDAGLGDTAKVDRTGPRGMFDLRRAFVFFDRRSKRVISVNDLHQTLSDLGYVDPPSPVQPFGSNGVSEGKTVPIDMHPGRSIAEEEDEDKKDGENTAVFEPGSFTSPSKLKLPVPSVSASTSTTTIDPMSLSPMRTSYSNGTLPATTTTEADIASTLLGDKIDQELRQGARALVVCIFKRIHGNSDPGNTGTSLLTKGEGEALLREDVGLLSGPSVIASGNTTTGTGYPPPLPPITYNVFARWAAPLSTKLRRIREKVQADFLAQATIGGGAKDFARAFHRIDANGDGQMSIREFRETLGPIARTLEPHEMQALCDYFDASGDGIIDFGEFLGMMGGNGNAIAHALAAELDDDDEYTLPNE